MMPNLATIQSLAEIVAKFGQAFALLVGALWVLVNYVLDRIHVRRLQLELATTLEQQGDLLRLVVTISVTNPGKTNVRITRKGSAFMIFSLANRDTFMLKDERDWKHEHLFDIFTEGRSIERDALSVEPGITVREDQLLLLPVNHQSYLMVLRVRSGRFFVFGRPRSWTYAKVLTTSLAGATNGSWKAVIDGTDA